MKKLYIWNQCVQLWKQSCVAFLKVGKISMSCSTKCWAAEDLFAEVPRQMNVVAPVWIPGDMGANWRTWRSAGSFSALWPLITGRSAWCQMFAVGGDKDILAEDRWIPSDCSSRRYLSVHVRHRDLRDNDAKVVAHFRMECDRLPETFFQRRICPVWS